MYENLQIKRIYDKTQLESTIGPFKPKSDDFHTGTFLLHP